MATDAGPRGRHFYASLLISRSCSVQTVQRRLGHQSAMETLDTYGHLWPDSDDETRAAVDHVLAGIDERRAVWIFVKEVLTHPHRAATWEFSAVHHQRPLDSVTPGDQIQPTPGVPACGDRRQRGGRHSRPTPVRDA